MLRASISRAAYRAARRWEQARPRATYCYRPALTEYAGAVSVRFVFARPDDPLQGRAGGRARPLVMPTRLNQEVTFLQDSGEQVELAWSE